MGIAIMEGAEPFLLPGGRDGALLVHGFTATPAEMRLLGEYLGQAGFSVLGVRLTGHGTSPADLEHTRREDWLGSVLDGYDILSGLTERIAVIGLSMGGLLSLQLEKYRQVWKAVSIAAPVFLREEKHLRELPEIDRAAGKFISRPHKLRPGLERYALSYEEMPLRSVHELLSVMEETRSLLPSLTVPLLVAQGRRDHTVRPKSAEYIYDKAGSAEKELFWLENSGHRATLEPERELLFERVAGFLRG